MIGWQQTASQSEAKSENHVCVIYERCQLSILHSHHCITKKKKKYMLKLSLVFNDFLTWVLAISKSRFWLVGSLYFKPMLLLKSSQYFLSWLIFGATIGPSTEHGPYQLWAGDANWDCHPCGHFWDYHLGALSLNQVTATQLKITTP